MPHMMAPLHVLPWEQEHVTHTRLKLNFYTHKPSFQCYTTCAVILIQPKTSHQASRVLWHYVHNLSGVLNISYLFLIIFKLEGIGCCRTQRSAALWRHAGPSPYNGGRGGDWDKWRQKVWDGSILGTSVDSSSCQLEAAVENRAASMNNGSNRSIDPSCTDQPPLAIDIILSEYISPPSKTNSPQTIFVGISLQPPNLRPHGSDCGSCSVSFSFQSNSGAAKKRSIQDSSLGYRDLLYCVKQRQTWGWTWASEKGISTHSGLQ